MARKVLMPLRFKYSSSTLIGDMISMTSDGKSSAQASFIHCSLRVDCTLNDEPTRDGIVCTDPDCDGLLRDGEIDCYRIRARLKAERQPLRRAKRHFSNPPPDDRP
jgi:hypothetical protein